MMMKLLSVVMPSLAVVLSCCASVAAQKASTEWTEKAVAATFQKRCASCHVVPDVSVRTDRAWLDQINRTT